MTHSILKQLNKKIDINSEQLEDLLAEIAQDAKRRRQEGANERPYAALRSIRHARLGAIQLPIELGGQGASIRQVFEVVVRIAEVDSDVAHILRAHFGYVEQLLRDPNDHAEYLLRKIAEGAIIGNAITEQSKQQAGSSKYETKLRRDQNGYRLTGQKYFSTGTLYADYVYVLASDEQQQPVALIVPTHREGIRIEDDWDGIGQRLTASGTTIFNDVRVELHELYPSRIERTPFNAFPQLYISAIVVGILRSIVTEASELLKSRVRTFSFATASIPSQDAQLLQIVGELSSIAFVTEAALLKAAEELTIASQTAVNGEIAFTKSHEASLAVAHVKVVLDRLATHAGSLLFDVGGASATKQSAQLDRHWRNIRTLISHNPAIYKARAIGDYRVNKALLPLHAGYF